MKRTITEIIVENDEILVVKTNGKPVIHRCGICQRQAAHALPETAARISNLTPRTIYRLIEAGRLHFFENESGIVYVCLSSLADFPAMETKNENRKKLEEKK